MNAFEFSCLLTSISSFVIAIFVLARNRKSRPHRYWFLMSLSMAIWSLALLGVVHADERYVALTWQYILDFAAILIPPFYYNFVLTLTGEYSKHRKFRIISLTTTLFFLILSFTPLFKIGVLKIYEFNYWINPGPLYALFPIFFGVHLSASFYLLFRFYKKATGLKKFQVKYILLAGIIGFLGGSTNFLPQLFNVYPFGNYLVVFYIISVAYAITKYRFLDIRIVLLRTIVYTLLIILTASLFVGLSVLVTSNLLPQNLALPASAIIAIIVVLGLDPLKRLLGSITDKFLFKGRIDYGEEIRKLGLLISEEINLESLVNSLTLALKEDLKINKAALLLPLNKGFQTLPSVEKLKIPELLLDNPLVHELSRNRKLIVAEELDRLISDTFNEKEREELQKVKKEIDRLNFSLVMPVMSENKLIAILLAGEKLSGEIYSQEDIDLFETIAPQIAIALSKANLYEQVKGKVDELTALHELGKVINSTLDLEKVLDAVMDAVIKVSGADRGLLYLLDKEGKTLKATVGRGGPYEMYKNLEVSVDKSILRKVIESRQALVVEDVAKESDINKSHVERVKTPGFIAVPLMTKEKVLGVIGVDNQKTKRPLSEINVNLLSTLANQAAIAIENSRLYHEIEGFTKTLQQKVDAATAEIKRLYDMKGEFLDIASHQLRTPVSVIMGTLDMLKEGTLQKLPQEKQDKFIDNVFQKAKKLGSIINDLLSASEMDTGRMDMEDTMDITNIEPLIEKIVNDAMPRAKGKGLDLKFNKPDVPLPKVNISERYLNQAITNLVDNAVKYTKEGWVVVKVYKQNGNVQIEVADTGIGIPKTDMPKLFQKFIRAKNAKDMYTDGSGLGLFIIKKIVESHPGGKVWVKSEEGQGSKFFIRLPAAN